MHIWWCRLSYIYWISPRIFHHVFCTFDVIYMHVLCNLHAFYTHLTLYIIYISSSFNYSCISDDLHYPIYIEFHLIYLFMFFVHLMWDICTYCVIYMHSMHDWHTLPLRLWVYITINTYVVLPIAVCNEFNFFGRCSYCITSRMYTPLPFITYTPACMFHLYMVLRAKTPYTTSKVRQVRFGEWWEYVF